MLDWFLGTLFWVSVFAAFDLWRCNLGCHAWTTRGSRRVCPLCDRRQRLYADERYGDWWQEIGDLSKRGPASPAGKNPHQLTQEQWDFLDGKHWN